MYERPVGQEPGQHVHQVEDQRVRPAAEQRHLHILAATPRREGQRRKALRGREAQRGGGTLKKTAKERCGRGTIKEGQILVII
jgi:hypothetical protein